ncbi:DGQHR domain-containing protein [Rhizobium sp. NLR9b]|uniref:DNA sulfur modification protein DndB n=1 Tax=unclassified Rhizobium TaxID=2613769 RepID=UPI001C831450|nr:MULTISPECIES: DNA sulfur modification protein DndB [unclassified Rhizobium]MBX5227516.1 DGQHR domain-containing protein [Rhizobium sp. NLR9b]MBX5288560.1 DGQHR domain-containing protein [Rhizobium sp. NLR10b]
MAIQIPVVKGKTLSTEYWLGSLSFSAISKYVKLPENTDWDDVFGGKGEQEAQRKLNKTRVNNEIVPYLLRSDDAFFSSLALILVPASGKPLKEGPDFKFIPMVPDSKIGMLEIDESIDMFPADGQHRTAAIIEALKQDRARMTSQEVPVVLLPYVDKDKLRQHFSDLNLNAKPVSQSMGYAFESRDPIVIITKRIMRDVPLFEKRVNEISNSLARKSPDVITMGTLVQAHHILLEAIYGPKYKDAKEITTLRQRDPNEDRVGTVAAKLQDVWEVVIDNVPEWDDLMNGKVTARELREGDEAKNTTGYVFAFGLGWQAIATAAAALIKDERDDWSEDLAHCLRSVDWKKGGHWHGIAMVGDRVNNTGPSIKATAGYVLRKGGLVAGSGEVGRLVGAAPHEPK